MKGIGLSVVGGLELDEFFRLASQILPHSASSLAHYYYYYYYYHYHYHYYYYYYYYYYQV